jgi:sugar phosphate isomerase/epimerase
MARRRDVLASLLSVPAASLAHPACSKSFSDTGLQLYTVRGLLARDYEGTLARVAELGYRQVEFAGVYPASPRQTLAMLKRHGLAAPSGHASYQELDRDLDSALRTANELKQQFIVCPSVDEGRRRSLDDWKRLGQRFNRIGAEARRAGLVFAYHNHDFEFPLLGGQVPYDVLLDETDPALVKLEIDLYWMAKAGRDPLAYFQKYPARFPLVHLKDMARDGTITELGQGTIDFKRILADAELAGIVQCFVEHDDPADPMRSIETSLRYLRQL